jgi:hypothetical protein
MGEVIELSGGGSSLGLISTALSLVGLCIVALLQDRPGNDDDDHTPGGGLMQPVGSAA